VELAFTLSAAAGSVAGLIVDLGLFAPRRETRRGGAIARSVGWVLLASAAAAHFRPGGDPEDVQAVTRFTLRSVVRHQALSEEVAELDAQHERLVAEAAKGGPSTCRASAPSTPRRFSFCREQPREAQERGILRQPLRRLAGK
jgi:hypothetical protein